MLEAIFLLFVLLVLIMGFARDAPLNHGASLARRHTTSL